ncbi:MAG TPA: hypothetical protein PLQ93_13290 [Bacteroidia bacterium]|nr:hypothetical protein [Bacteroidia bacterium]
MKVSTRRIFLFLALGFSLGLSAAPAPPPSATGGPGCWPPPCVPIDGGIGLLMAAGAAYGARKLYRSRNTRHSSL